MRHTILLLLVWLYAGAASALCLDPPGDISGNGETTVADVQCTIILSLWVLDGQPVPAPPCLEDTSLEAADLSCDGALNVTDVLISVSLALGASLHVEVDADQNGCPDICEDVAAPGLTIASPLDGAVLGNVPAVDVLGQIDAGPGATVFVNGIEASLSGTTWSAEDVPLGEGNNTITAVADDGAGNTTLVTIHVLVDVSAPVLNIETPPDGAVLATTTVDVAGMVGDLVAGTTIQEDDVVVDVNGVPATVFNRSWIATEVPLQQGANTLVATATDAGGNSRSFAVEILSDTTAGQQLRLASGSGQQGMVGEWTDDPLTVALVDAQGDPLPGRNVVFSVSRGEGALHAPPASGTEMTVVTNDDGVASISYALGHRAGSGNHRVRATSTGAVGFVEFSFSAEPGPAHRITAVQAAGQHTLADAPAVLPPIALLTDAFGNCVGDVPVTFTVEEGTGTVDGGSQATLPADLDGRVQVDWVLGPELGQGAQRVVATFPEMPEGAEPALFIADVSAGGNALATTITGVVLTTEDEPIPGATISVDGTDLAVVTDDEGRFELGGAPPGTQHLRANGGTTDLEGAWPTVVYEVHVLPGVENGVGMPIYLPIIDAEGARTVGGPVDVTLTLEGVPGAELTVFANSATCPDGSSTCDVAWTQVNQERVPMPAPNRSSFDLAWTVQPPGVYFDPPARVCLPNPGAEPGDQREVFSFDHDIEEWVALGTATVTDDGRQICSDPGFGINKSGWGGTPPPPPPNTCFAECGKPPPCFRYVCKKGGCVLEFAGSGEKCEVDGDDCTVGICSFEEGCVEQPLPDETPCEVIPIKQCAVRECLDGKCSYNTNKKVGTSCGDGSECSAGAVCDVDGLCINTLLTGTSCMDGLVCTDPDFCDNGACIGTPKICPIAVAKEFDLTNIKTILEDFAEAASPATPCSIDFNDGAASDAGSSFKILGELGFECCEQKEGDCTGVMKAGAEFGMSAAVKCEAIGLTQFIPSAFKELFTLGIFLEFKADGSIGGSVQRSDCKDEYSFCAEAKVAASFGVSAEAQAISDKVLSVVVGGSVGAALSVACCNTDTLAKLSGNIGKTEGVVEYTIAGFIKDSFKFTFLDGISSGDVEVPCPISTQ